jgi:hypothetical protein
MALNFNVPSPTAGQQACKTVEGIYRSIAEYLSQRLGEIVVILSEPGTAVEYWQLQGSDGASHLAAFAAARSLLQSIDPTKVSAELAAAGSTLVPNQDGTVTVPAE